MLTRRNALKALAWLGFSGLPLSAYAVGVEPLLRLSIAEYKLTPPGWPKNQKLRMVILADIHAVHPWMSVERIRSIVAKANALNGDIVLLLGDYVSGTRFFRKEILTSEWGPELGQLRAPLGVHAILGNHDWWEDNEAMANAAGPTQAHKALLAAGINVLENAAVRIVHDGKPFWLAGLGDQMAFHPIRRSRNVKSGMDDLPKTLAAITDDAPAILMAHEPDIFPRVPKRFAITLCGHTHGGQVSLFGWRPAAGSPLSRIYQRGHFRENGRDLLVSSGLGCSIAPIRLGVPPEIMVVELGGVNTDGSA